MRKQLFKGALLDESKSKICVLFDPQTRAVVHVHGFSALGDAEPIDDAELERQTVGHAKRFGRYQEGLRTAYVPLSWVREGMVTVNEAGDGVTRVPSARACRLRGALP